MIAKHLAMSLKNDSESKAHICKRLSHIARTHLNEGDWLHFESRYIDFSEHSFPEVNTISLKG